MKDQPRQRRSVAGSRLQAVAADLAERLLGASTLEEVSSLALDAVLALTRSDSGWAGRLDTQTETFAVSARRPEGVEPPAVLLTDPWLRDPRLGRTEAPDPSLRAWTLEVPALLGDAVVGRVALTRRAREYGPEEVRAVSRLAGLYAPTVGRVSFDDRLGSLGELDAPLFDSHPDGVAIIADGRFVRVSPAFADLLGRPADEILGHIPTEFVVAEDHAATQARMASAQGGTRERPSEYSIVRPDRTPLTAEAVTRVIVWQARPAFLIVFRDISRRKAAEDELRRRERILSALAEFDETISHLSTEKVLRSALGFLLEKTGVARLNVVSLDAEHRWGTVTATAGDPATGSEAGARFKLSGTLTGLAATSGQPRYVPNDAAVSGGSSLGREMTEGGLRSAFVVPLVSGGGCVGTLNAGSPAPDAIGQDARELLTRLAPRLSAALENSRLYEEQEKSERRYRNIYDTVPVSIWEEDFSELKEELDRLRSAGVEDIGAYAAENPEFAYRAAKLVRIANVNDYTLKLYGARSKEELLGALDRVFTAESYPTFASQLAALYSGQTFVECEGVNRTLSGDAMAVMLRVELPGPSGDFSHVTVAVTDLTRRKAVEDELRERVALENLVMTISTGFLSLDAEQIEDGFRQALGAVGTFTGADRTFLLLFSPEATTPEIAVEWAAWKKEQGVPSRGLRTSVSELPWFAALLGRGEVVKIGSLSEIPAEGRTERSLLTRAGVKSLALVPILSKGGAVGVLGLHRRTSETSWSPNAMTLLKIAGDIFMTTVERARAERGLREARDGLEWRVRQRTADLEQAKKDLEQDIAARERTEKEKERLEAELRQSRVLEAVGQLAGGVAHDFNNILGSVIGCLYSARLRLGTNEAVREELDRAQNLCKRGGELTRQLLTVARRRPGVLEGLSVGSLLDELRLLLDRTLPKNIELEIAVPPGLPLIRGDRTTLMAALLNLGLNARDAMPRGGRLRFVASEAAEARETRVQIAVSDTGVGIPKGLRDRVFDPFFTTKAPGEGSGLGLSMVAATVRELGGRISFESEPGEGTTFVLRFPAGGSAAVVAGAAGDRRAHPLTTAPFLVVEDEDGIAHMVQQALKAAGYSATRVGTGLKALEAIRDLRGNLGLVILDLMLPELGGEEVYRLLRGLAPEVPVLVTTGREDLGKKLGPDVALLPKPFGSEELLDAVSGVLTQGVGRPSGEGPG